MDKDRRPPRAYRAEDACIDGRATRCPKQEEVHLRPNLKVECVVEDQDTVLICDTILKHARTGSVSDGKLFVIPVEASYRIRTGESGEETLQAHPGADAAPA